MSRHTSLYRVVAYVLNLNGDMPDAKTVKQELESHRHPEFLHVEEIRETDVGEWHDDHPLNKSTANMAVYDSYFAELDATEKDPWFKQEHRRVRDIMMAQIKKNSDLERQIEDLKAELKKLQNVKEFVNTIKSL